MTPVSALAAAEEATTRLERDLDAAATAADLAALLVALRAALDDREAALTGFAAAADSSADHLDRLEALAARGQALITRLAAERERAVRELATARQLVRGLAAPEPAPHRLDCKC